jgi:hypothetical protein
LQRLLSRGRVQVRLAPPADLLDIHPAMVPETSATAAVRLSR